MKVIYTVGSTLGSGGVGIHAGEAVKQLYKAGVLEKVVCAGVKEGFVDKELSQQINTIPVEAPWKLPGNRFYYPNWLKDTIFDRGSSLLMRRTIDNFQLSTFNSQLFLHTWNGHGLQTIRKAKKLGIKTIVERNSLYPTAQEALLKKEFEKFGLEYKPTHSISLKRNIAELEECDYIATPSKLVYDSLIDAGLPKTKVWQPNPLGVNQDFFSAVRASVSTGREPITDSLNFIFVGGDPIRKGLIYLLKAWKHLTENSQFSTFNSQLFLLGLPPRIFDHAPFREYEDLPGLVNLGWANTIEYYRKSHVFVLPSVEDGWGLVVGEAMAVGLPVIVSVNAGASDMVTKESGFIVPACSEEALCKKMLYLINNADNAIKMGKAAQNQAKKYTWEVYGKRLLNNYQFC